MVHHPQTLPTVLWLVALLHILKLVILEPISYFCPSPILFLVILKITNDLPVLASSIILKEALLVFKVDADGIICLDAEASVLFLCENLSNCIFKKNTWHDDCLEIMETILENKIQEVLSLKFRPPYDHPLRQCMWEERKDLYESLEKEQRQFFKMYKKSTNKKEQQYEMKMKRLDAWIQLYTKQKQQLLDNQTSQNELTSTVRSPPIITDATVSPELGCAQAVPSETPTT